MSKHQEDKRYEDLKSEFRARIEGREGTIADVVNSRMTMDQRLALLQELGKDNLIEQFKEWRPRSSKTKKRGAPLDQRVAISVTEEERYSLDADIARLKREKSVSTMAQFIRNRAIGSVDIEGWRAIVVEALAELEETFNNKKELKKKRENLMIMIDDEADPDEAAIYQEEALDIQQRLDRIVAQNKKRSHRLTGRMSMVESETVKHRASKLGISVSDYLRIMIFALEPNSNADAHMSYESKLRFYLGIIDVADNGWGEVPKIYNCTQCENYLSRIGELEEQVRQLQSFSD